MLKKTKSVKKLGTKLRKEISSTPKYGKNKSVTYSISSVSPAQSASSTPKSQFTAVPVLCFHPPPPNLSKPIHIGQLKRKRKGMSNNNSNNSSSSNGHSSHPLPNANRPTFQFRIGMDVGVALGDCFLQLTKLENCMDKLRETSVAIKDVMTCIKRMGVAQNTRKRSRMLYTSYPLFLYTIYFTHIRIALIVQFPKTKSIHVTKTTTQSTTQLEM